MIVFKKLAHGFYFVIPTSTQIKQGSGSTEPYFNVAQDYLCAATLTKLKLSGDRYRYRPISLAKVCTSSERSYGFLSTGASRSAGSSNNSVG